MNVPLRIKGLQGDQELEKKFVEEAAENGMVNLKGHRYINLLVNKVYHCSSGIPA